MNSAPANARDTIFDMSQVPYGPGPAGPAPWQGPPPSGGPSRVPTIIAIVIAVIAVAVAIGAWFRPIPKPEAPAAKAYSDQEVSDAKKAVCDAFDRGQQILSVTGSKVGSNPTESFVIAVNSRVAITTIISYWKSTIQQQPAAPSDLIKGMGALTDTYQEILLKLLADKSGSDLDSLYSSVDSSVPKLTESCK